MLAHNFGAKFQKYIRRKMVLQKKIENNEQDATEKSLFFDLVPLNITSFMNFLSDMSMISPIHSKNNQT